MRFLTKSGAARALAGLIVAFVLGAALLPAGGATPARAIIAAPPAYYPSGPQTSVNQSALTGWTVCYSDLYNNSSTSLATILAGCSGEYLLLAAGLGGIAGGLFGNHAITANNQVLVAGGAGQLCGIYACTIVFRNKMATRRPRG